MTTNICEICKSRKVTADWPITSGKIKICYQCLCKILKEIEEDEDEYYRDLDDVFNPELEDLI